MSEESRCLCPSRPHHPSCPERSESPRERFDRLTNHGAPDTVAGALLNAIHAERPDCLFPEGCRIHGPGAEEEPKVAWEREETEPCEKGTVGCSVLHSAEGRFERSCETW